MGIELVKTERQKKVLPSRKVMYACLKRGLSFKVSTEMCAIVSMQLVGRD
jgi:hypothetical protein